MHPEATEFNHYTECGPQTLLILVGLIASGKSTFAQALEAHFQFCRCNQDDLGDRQAVEELARTSLGQGFSVCIDRTNFNETQRAHWIAIAREFPGIKIWCLVFDTPLHVCVDRLRHRRSHPTIHSPEEGVMVLHRFAAMYKPPSLDEGLDRILHLKPEDHPSSTYTRDELKNILVRISTSPSAAINVQTDIRQYFSQSGSGQTARPANDRYVRQNFYNGESRALDNGEMSWRPNLSTLHSTHNTSRSVPPVVVTGNSASPKALENGTAEFPFTLD